MFEPFSARRGFNTPVRGGGGPIGTPEVAAAQGAARKARTELDLEISRRKLAEAQVVRLQQLLNKAKGTLPSNVPSRLSTPITVKKAPQTISMEASFSENQPGNANCAMKPLPAQPHADNAPLFESLKKSQTSARAIYWHTGKVLEISSLLNLALGNHPDLTLLKTKLEELRYASAKMVADIKIPTDLNGSR